jgi:hypothetical protein
VNGLCRGTNHIDDKAGVGEHGDVAALDLKDGGAHTLRHEALRSLLATMYQLGFDLQAVPSSFWLNKSAAGAN